MAEATVTYAGWVYKEGSLIKNWKKRFLVVKRRELAYYKSSNPRSASLMGSMRIARAERAVTITNGLIIYSMEGRELRLFMDTAGERDKCYDAIVEWCHPKPAATVAPRGSTTASAHTSSTHRGVDTTPKPTERSPVAQSHAVGDRNSTVAKPPGNQAQMSGWLEKQGQNVPTWKRRYFELRGGILTYASHETGPALARHRVVDVRRDRTRPFTLLLSLDTGRELRVSGESEHEIHDWQSAIRATFEANAAAGISSQDYGRPPGYDVRETLTSGATGESWNNLFGAAPPASVDSKQTRNRDENLSFGRNLRLDFDGENTSFIECDIPVDAKPPLKPFSPTAPSADSIRKMRIDKNLEDDETSTTTRISSSHRPSSTDPAQYASGAPGPCCCVVM